MANAYKVTESILYHYRDINSYIEDLEEKLNEAKICSWADLKAIRYDKINIKTYEINKSTENVALAKIDYIDELSKELAQNRKIKLSVERSLSRLKIKERKLVELIYFREMNYKKCLDILQIDKSTYFRMKDRVIKKISVCMFGVGALETDILNELGYKYES